LVAFGRRGEARKKSSVLYSDKKEPWEDMSNRRL